MHWVGFALEWLIYLIPRIDWSPRVESKEFLNWCALLTGSPDGYLRMWTMSTSDPVLGENDPILSGFRSNSDDVVPRIDWCQRVEPRNLLKWCAFLTGGVDCHLKCGQWVILTLFWWNWPCFGENDPTLSRFSSSLDDILPRINWCPRVESRYFLNLCSTTFLNGDADCHL